MTLSNIQPGQMFFFADIRDWLNPFVVIDERSPLPDRIVVKNLRNEAIYLRRSDEAVREIGLLFIFQKLVLDLPGSFIFLFQTSESRFSIRYYRVLPSDSPQKSHISFYDSAVLCYQDPSVQSLLIVDLSFRYFHTPMESWILTNQIYKLPGAFYSEYKT